VPSAGEPSFRVNKLDLLIALQATALMMMVGNPVAIPEVLPIRVGIAAGAAGVSLILSAIWNSRRR
jgi:hypothetical protein